MAGFSLQAKTVIESATLDLTARQLEELAVGAKVVDELVSANYGTDTPAGLRPVQELLYSISSLVEQAGTIAPKRRSPTKRNPTAGKQS